MFDTKQNEQEVAITSSSRIRPLVGVMLILASLAVYVFVASPVSSSFSAMNDQISAKVQETAKIKDQLKQFDEISKQLDLSTEVQQMEVLKSVPLTMQQDQVIRDVITIAKNNDIDLHSISFGQGTSGKEGISTLKVNASFEGYYSDLLSFLEGIEQNGRALHVSSISVQMSASDVSKTQRATFSLSMDSFYQGK
jgi:Tfp pilus assembly protein PilO